MGSYPCDPAWPGTCYVEQAGFKLMAPSCSSIPSAGRSQQASTKHALKSSVGKCSNSAFTTGWEVGLRGVPPHRLKSLLKGRTSRPVSWLLLPLPDKRGLNQVQRPAWGLVPTFSPLLPFCNGAPNNIYSCCKGCGKPTYHSPVLHDFISEKEKMHTVILSHSIRQAHESDMFSKKPPVSKLET